MKCALCFAHVLANPEVKWQVVSNAVTAYKGTALCSAHLKIVLDKEKPKQK